MSGMALVPAGHTSHSNGGNNEVKGKVGGGGDGVEEEVGGRRETVALMKAVSAIMKAKASYYTPYIDS
jgi:hypothetical protein